MEKNLSRRHALTGALAIAAAALPALARAAVSDEDTALFNVIRQWQTGKALEISFGAEHTAMERLAKVNQPPVPSELMQAIELPSGLEKPSDARGWTVKELERFAELTSEGKFTRIDTDRGYDLRFTEVPVPEAVRTKAQELLAVKKRYDASYDAVWKEAEAGQERFDQIVSHNTDLILQLADTPANTLEGLLAKCHVCNTEHLFEWHCSFNEVAQSLVKDIERLAPQFIGRA
ncbi:MAG: hypothetical protein ABIN69_05115 [Aestuariivirga sp.]